MASQDQTGRQDQLRQVLKDFRHISAIPVETLQVISNALLDQRGFLNLEGCRQLLAQYLEDESQVAAVLRAVHGLREEGLDRFLAVIHQRRSESVADGKLLSEDEFVAAKERLPALVRSYPALQRSQRARRLASALGNEVTGFEFICDARPVYSEENDDIEGIVPITTLSVVYRRQTGEDAQLELTFAEEALSELIAAAEEAKKRLTVLKDRVQSWIPGGVAEVGE